MGKKNKLLHDLTPKGFIALEDIPASELIETFRELYGSPAKPLPESKPRLRYEFPIESKNKEERE